MSMIPGRFLVVDDNIVVREMFADALRLEGHTVRTAANAAAALDDVVSWEPDAILIDYRMGVINGLGFLYRLRAHESVAHTPVAVITGQVDLEGISPPSARAWAQPSISSRYASRIYGGLRGDCSPRPLHWRTDGGAKSVLLGDFSPRNCRFRIHVLVLYTHAVPRCVHGNPPCEE